MSLIPLTKEQRKIVCALNHPELQGYNLEQDNLIAQGYFKAVQQMMNRDVRAELIKVLTEISANQNTVLATGLTELDIDHTAEGSWRHFKIKAPNGTMLSFTTKHRILDATDIREYMIKQSITIPNDKIVSLEEVNADTAYINQKLDAINALLRSINAIETEGKPDGTDL